MNAPDEKTLSPAIIVFDGVCVLCNGWIDFLLKHDVRERYRFAAMQTPAGRELLLKNGLNPDDPVSFLLLDESGAHTDTDAIIRVISGLDGLWKIAMLGKLLPRFVRNPLYRMIARNRYRWFGQTNACRMPDAQTAHRFIE